MIFDGYERTRAFPFQSGFDGQAAGSLLLPNFGHTTARGTRRYGGMPIASICACATRSVRRTGRERSVEHFFGKPDDVRPRRPDEGHSQRFSRPERR